MISCCERCLALCYHRGLGEAVRDVQTTKVTEVRAVVAKSDHLSLIPILEAEDQLSKLQPWQVHAYTLIQQRNKSN